MMLQGALGLLNHFNKVIVLAALKEKKNKTKHAGSSGQNIEAGRLEPQRCHPAVT